MFKAQYHDETQSPIDANLRKGVYAIALPQGSYEDYAALLNAYTTSPNPDEREDAIRGLGSLRDPNIVQQLLDLILTDEIKAQHVRIIPNTKFFPERKETDLRSSLQ